MDFGFGGKNNKLRLIDKLSSSRFRRMSKLKMMNDGRQVGMTFQLSERQGSNVHLVAPPNISMLASVQEKTFPVWALLLQVARL